ncbi:MAG: DUF4236 domain-containing protein [Cyclobacteriaceae bacterium]
MGVQYRKRIRLGKGLGVNISNAGLSTSYRSKYGSVSSRGFSVRTGIPGLSFRTSWGKGANGLIALVFVGLVYIAIIVGYNFVRLLYYLGKAAFTKLSHKIKSYK